MHKIKKILQKNKEKKVEENKKETEDINSTRQRKMQTKSKNIKKTRKMQVKKE